MNLNQLRAFHKVAECGSFTAAAVAMRVTQPALTNQIKGLEGHYEVELFYRKARSIELTPTGRTLFQITEELFGMVDKAEGVLSQSSEALSGILRIGADSPYQLVELLERFQAEYPNIRLEVSFGNSQAIAASLRNFQVDVALMSQIEEDTQFYSIHSHRDSLIAIVNKGHPWRERKTVTLKKFHQERLIRREVGSHTQLSFDEACKADGIQPDYVVQMGSREALREAVAAGMGIGIIPEPELGNDDRLVPITIRGASLVVDDYVVCLKTRKNAPLIGAFLELQN